MKSRYDIDCRPRRYTPSANCSHFATCDDDALTHTFVQPRNALPAAPSSVIIAIESCTVVAVGKALIDPLGWRRNNSEFSPLAFTAAKMCVAARYCGPLISPLNTRN